MLNLVSVFISSLPIFACLSGWNQNCEEQVVIAIQNFRHDSFVMLQDLFVRSRFFLVFPLTVTMPFLSSSPSFVTRRWMIINDFALNSNTVESTFVLFFLNYLLITQNVESFKRCYFQLKHQNYPDCFKIVLNVVFITHSLLNSSSVVYLSLFTTSKKSPQKKTWVNIVQVDFMFPNHSERHKMPSIGVVEKQMCVCW